MSTTVAVAPEPSGPPLSQAERLINMVASPSKTFHDINRSAAFWAPLLLIVIMQVAFVFTIDKKIGFDNVAQNNLRMNESAAERIQQLPPDQRERQMNAMTTGTKVFSYGFPVIWFVFILIISLVLMATLNFGLGAEAKFSAVLAVSIYSGFIPGMVRSGLAMISLLVGVDPESFIIQNPVATNPAYFLNPAENRVLYALASQLDITMIWTLVLTAIGLTCISKVKKGAAFGTVFGWWAVVVLLSVGAAAAFS